MVAERNELEQASTQVVIDAIMRALHEISNPEFKEAWKQAQPGNVGALVAEGHNRLDAARRALQRRQERG